ncbi:MAG: GH25 family lysozyme [Lachnospiraceae bacterium]|nr:GH25 family lysozyme [Lachnospiraceae bacterium]
MFSRDNRGDDLFANSTFDTSNPDKIIIREKEAKRKVRRRVKKGTKDQVLAKKEAIKKADKVKVVKSKKTEKLAYDTTSFDFIDLDSSSRADDKDFRLPRLSEINKKRDDFEKDDLGSDFRRSSADWKDSKIPDYSALNDLSDSSFGGGFFDGFKSMSALQWIAAGLALVLFGSSIMTTNVYANLQCKDNRDQAFSKLSTYEDTTFEQVAASVEDIEIPISMEEATPEVGKVLSLVLSSVEKDLKIKLVDEDDTLVKHVPWSVTVESSDGNSSEEVDDDQDGIIHMTDVNAGDYSVTLNPNDSLADFELPMAAQMVSVKAKVEYKVIANIKDEIKSEKEINVAAEDVAGNQAADQEAAPPPAMADTVEFVESTKTINGEDYVEAAVDLTKTATIKKNNLFASLLEKVKATASGFKGSSLAYTAILADETPATEPGQENQSPEPSTESKPDQPATEPDPTPTHNLKYVSNGDGTHTEKCQDSGCSETGNTGDCTFKGDNSKQACDICGASNPNYKAAHVCSLSTVQNNESVHTIKCTDGCDKGYPKDEGHSFDGNGQCTKCGYKKSEPTLTINATTLTLTVGEATTLSASVTPSAPVKYSSSDASVASVDGSGRITAVKAGTATITASASVDGKNPSATCQVTVNAKAEEASIQLSGNTSVKVNEKTTITAKITPEGKVIEGVTFSDTSIAKSSVDGFTITVQGLKAGSTKMTVKSDNGKESTVTINVDGGEYSDDAQLYDAFKNALYVKDGDTYRLAKYRDYKRDKTQKFYIKQETFLYTGWQTIDGVKCYFDKDHNRVTGKQIIGGVEYDFGETGSVSTGSGTLGIDVSKYQPSINWSAVKSSGVDYVIIRCGYRGSSTGVLVEDPYFKSHIKGAKAAGLKVGVYFFTTAVTEAEAVEEASMCAYLCKGYGLDFPIFMDCESSPRPGYNGMSSGQRTAIVKAFCNTIRSAGYTPGVYANKTWLSSYMNAGELSGYKIWLAQYNAAPTYSGRYDMWQYTSKGSVNGISGYVDMNKCYYR